jgi:hypothetical protein
MTVLPQLERALVEACRSEHAAGAPGSDPSTVRSHDEVETRVTSVSYRRDDPTRRRRPHRVGAAVAVLASVLIVVVVAGGALLLANRRHSLPTARPTAAGQVLASVGAGRFGIAGGGTISHVYTFAGSTYIVWQPPGGKTGFELARINRVTGRVLADLHGQGTFGSAALIDGALWCTETVGNDTGRLTTIVTRNDPRTLQQLSAHRVTGVAFGGDTHDGALADTGRWTWVSDASGIDRFDSADGRSGLRIPIVRAEDGPQLAGSPGGLAVFISQGPRGILADGVRVQSRDPTTGALRGEAGYPHSKHYFGIEIAGIIGRQAWVLWGNPVSGPVGILDLTTGNARRLDVGVGLNPGSVAMISDNTLWIAPNEARNRVDCLDPDSGRLLGALNLINRGTFLAADAASVYAGVELGRNANQLSITAIPSTCRH